MSVRVYRLYFDIETYTREGRPQLTDKVITIAFKGLGTRPRVLMEWKTGEKAILEEFFGHVKSQYEQHIITELVGFNILRFDLPFLVARAIHHKIDSLENLFEIVIRNPFTIDLIQCLLPYNNFRFTGLSVSNIGIRLGIPFSQYPSEDIAKFYENKEYKKIEEHVISDVLFVERLDRTLRQKAFFKEILKF